MGTTIGTDSPNHRPSGPVTLARKLAVGALALGLLVGVAGCGGDSGDEGSAKSTTTAPGGSTTLGSGGDGTEATGEGGEFLALSYNVAGLPAEISKEHPDVNLPKISPLLEEFDLVLTQEDFDWWGELAGGFDFVNYHDRLRADVTHEYRSTKHPGPDAVGLDTSLRPAPEVGDGLGTLSRFPIEEVARVPWTNCFGGMDTSDGGAADCLSMKGFSHTHLTLADGVVVDVYNLHGEAGGSPRDQELQADDYEQLAAYIAEHSKGAAVIVAGDTNLHTDNEHPDGSQGADIEIWDKFLEATGLTDSCTATECDDPGRIDKFAYRSGKGVDLEILTRRFRTDFVDAAGDDLSDHQALEVRFRWTPA
ncbi:MAG: endonuclease/exonuclease/phosphatase family protein [Microthrixaceae bacterium]|nr:endonuclease/exonuclease/phosphatase family protein [Acidimicrobiales bacterium]MCB9402942.1 endonuclease/exonuclease/phosphatase family protein [Microthrixaceae bacterium]